MYCLKPLTYIWIFKKRKLNKPRPLSAARRLLSRFIWLFGGGAGFLEKHLGLARNSSCHSPQGCEGSEVGSAVHCARLEPKIPYRRKRTPNSQRTSLQGFSQSNEQVSSSNPHSCGRRRDKIIRTLAVAGGTCSGLDLCLNTGSEVGKVHASSASRV